MSLSQEFAELFSKAFRQRQITPKATCLARTTSKETIKVFGVGLYVEWSYDPAYNDVQICSIKIADKEAELVGLLECSNILEEAEEKIRLIESERRIYS